MSAPAHRVLLDLSTDAVSIALTAPDDGQPPLRGYLEVRPRGREPLLDADELKGVLQARNIVLHDAAMEALDDLVARFNTRPEALEPLLLLEGTGPTGKDGELEWLVQRPTPLNELPPPDDWENVDLHERAPQLLAVHAGTPLVRIHPPEKGLPGRDVLGRDIPARGKPAPAARAGKNVKTEEDGKLLVASADGQIVFRRDTIDVEPVINLSNVNFASGNIHFPGVVRVRTEVLDAFVVEGARGVSVGGTVGAARIVATDGDVEVRGGVAEHEREPTIIAAGGHVRVGYANHADIEAGGDVVVTKETLNSRIRAGGQITVRNRLVGGTITAGEAVEASVIGSASGVRTIVVLAPNVWVSTELATRVVRVRQRIYARTVIRFGPHVHPFEDDVGGPVEVRFDAERGEIRVLARPRG